MSRCALVPVEVLTAKIPSGAIRAYAALALHADPTGICHPPLRTVCQAMGGKDRRRVQQWIRKLEVAGLVVRKPFMSSAGSRPNTYSLVYHPSPEEQES